MATKMGGDGPSSNDSAEKAWSFLRLLVIQGCNIITFDRDWVGVLSRSGGRGCLTTTCFMKKIISFYSVDNKAPWLKGFLCFFYERRINHRCIGSFMYKIPRVTLTGCNGVS